MLWHFLNKIFHYKSIFSHSNQKFSNVLIRFYLTDRQRAFRNCHRCCWRGCSQCSAVIYVRCLEYAKLFIYLMIGMLVAVNYYLAIDICQSSKELPTLPVSCITILSIYVIKYLIVYYLMILMMMGVIRWGQGVIEKVKTVDWGSGKWFAHIFNWSKLPLMGIFSGQKRVLGTQNQIIYFLFFS